MSVIPPTGSGSIADQMEIEGYSFKMSWPVIIDYSMELPSIISQGVSVDGYLTLNWAEPVLSHLELHRTPLPAVLKDTRSM